jgi:hypothetical protein
MLDEDLAELYDVETRRLNTPETYDRYEDGLDRRGWAKIPVRFSVEFWTIFQGRACI